MSEECRGLNLHDNEYTIQDDVLVSYHGSKSEVGDISYPITGIGSSAFVCNNKVTKVAVPDTVIHISNYAFESCHQLNCIEFGSGLKLIGDGAFLKCDSLTSVKLPEGLLRIGDFAFFGTSIKEVTIPASVVDIGESAFPDFAKITRAES